FAGLGIAELFAADYAESLEENVAAKQRAQALIDKAIALAPDLADGYAARGWQRTTILWDWSGGQADFEKAPALEPGNALVQRRYAILLSNLGRVPESIAAYRRAIELDPLSASAWTDLGQAYSLDRGQFRQAREALEHALAINPESTFAL